jgi:hypothetical protein
MLVTFRHVLLAGAFAVAPAAHASEWYWVNTVKPEAPDCIPLDVDPMSSLARTYGGAPMRVLEKSDGPEGRMLVIQVDPTKERFAYSTSLELCTRFKKALVGLDNRKRERQIAQRSDGKENANALTKPYLKTAMRQFALGRTKHEIMASFGKPSSIGDLSGDKIELWYYDHQVLPVYDDTTMTRAPKTVFTISQGTGKVLQVGF